MRSELGPGAKAIYKATAAMRQAGTRRFTMADVGKYLETRLHEIGSQEGLAAELGVSRATLRLAFGIAEVDGINRCAGERLKAAVIEVGYRSTDDFFHARPGLSIRRLARELGVSPATVRPAYHEYVRRIEDEQH